MAATGTIGTFGLDTATALVDRYIDIWNTTDADRRVQLIAETWAEDGIYLDPVMRGDGHGEIEAMIAGFQAQFPGVRFHRTATIDSHNDRLRFSWVLVAPAGPVIAIGTDLAVVSDDDRLQAVTGFFDQAPVLP